MRFDLPLAVADPGERIRAIHELTVKMRHEKSLSYTQATAGVLNMMPRWYIGSVLRNVDFVASDVPGIPIPVFLAGAAVRMQYAFGPTIGAALNVTLSSYVGTCAVGINTDTNAIPDPEVHYDCLVTGFDDVLAVANEPAYHRNLPEGGCQVLSPPLSHGLRPRADRRLPGIANYRTVGVSDRRAEGPLSTVESPIMRWR